MKIKGILILAVLFSTAIAHAAVTVTPDEANQKVTITIDGAPFTTYMWQPSLRKPVLYPLIAPDGTTLTRNNPPLPNERVDHPHHVGLWFNYSNVNGFDFWNNSDKIQPAQRPKMGSIHHEKILLARSGRNRGELRTSSTWTTVPGDDLLAQTADYIITKLPNGDRQLDLVITLQALTHVVFHDDKDGLLGLRVAQFLESPTEKGGIYADANGVQTKVAGGVSPLATGVYLTSEGKSSDAAWGTRGRWCLVSGTTSGKTETIAILDHPKNPGYPTYWHARGYGLFAANPLGVSGFAPHEAHMDFTLEKGQTATFRYRLLFMSHATTAAAMDAAQSAFAAKSE
jgi:hypothetical protein